jgi:hypothetical protein
MEDVLFDLYVAEAEITNNYTVIYSDSTFRQGVLNSVLRKHKITEADLDTSLFWYNLNLDRYLKINEKISARYSQMLDVLQPKQDEIERNLLPNDLFFPVYNKDFFLTIKDLPQHVYAFRSDTTLFNYGGEYHLQFEVLGITPAIHPIVSFYIKGVDTVYVRRDTLDRNGLFVSSLTIPTKRITKLSGTIYFPEVNKDMSIFIHNLEFLQRKKK